LIKQELTLKNIFLITAGWVSIVLGVIGIVMPLLPTTPFILLAAACFAKSSPRFHHWLITHKFFGPIIDNFKSGHGIPMKTKYRIILFIWLALGISMFAMQNVWIISVLGFLGIFGTIHILRMPTLETDRIE
jgi:uncharacterized membrane protein YbaN (DUF454 family)